jgi:hypothetical protein
MQETNKMITWKDAKNNIGKTVTIEAKVFEKIDAGEFWVLFMGASSTEGGTTGIEIKKSDVSKFPADMYAGKTIKITGELHTNPLGGGSFSLTDTAQVVVIG